MELVLNYAVISFRPYEEVGEFINVGVLAVECQSRFLTYRMLPVQRTRRVRSCFPEIDLSMYRSGLRRLERELAALSQETNQWSDDSGTKSSHPAQTDLFLKEGSTDLFQYLSRPRGSLFFYPIKGARLTDDMDRAVDELFAKYVDHQNQSPIDYEEKKLVKSLKEIFRDAKLDKYYRDCPRLGSESYHVGIPLAYTPKGASIPMKVIKPLNLNQSSPTRIYTHGDDWIAKVNRLRTLGLLPRSFLFAVNKAKSNPEKKAANDICRGLVKAGAEVAGVEEIDKILAFAKVEDPDDFVLVGE